MNQIEERLNELSQMAKITSFERRFSILDREINKDNGEELIRLQNKKKELDEEYLEWKKR